MLNHTSQQAKTVHSTYSCGCIHYTDSTWSLCEDCNARIGKHGTCLVCGEAADELWMANNNPELSGCSPECAHQAYIDSRESVNS